MIADQQKFVFYDDPMKYYNAMLDDILAAQKHVFIETYKFGHQSIGIKFRDALTHAANKGVEVKLLIDSWGSSSIPDHFFDALTAAGGMVRRFQKIKINVDFFTRSHRRNHRKITIIDNNICYIGSSNLTDYNIIWRESMLRIHGEIAVKFKKVFYQDFKIYNKYIRYRSLYTRIIRQDDCEILRDVPSISRQKIKNRYEHLIKNAKSEIVIESPYFLPGFFLRKAMMDAANRGVEVIVIIPKHSDVRLVNILHGRYLKMLHNNNIKFLYFTQHNLHAKIILIDNEIFSVGSPNFDYRSFRYMHEIALIGKNTRTVQMIRNHIDETIALSEPFNLESWQRRPALQKLFEWMILPFRHLL